MLYPQIEYVAATLGLPMFWQHVSATVVKQETQQDICKGILTAGVLALLTGDTISRGFMLEMFGERQKQWIAVAVSSIILASIHYQAFGPGLIVYMFLGTIASCILYIRVDYIYPTIIVHMISNTWASLIVPRIFSLEKSGHQYRHAVVPEVRRAIVTVAFGIHKRVTKGQNESSHLYQVWST